MNYKKCAIILISSIAMVGMARLIIRYKGSFHTLENAKDTEQYYQNYNSNNETNQEHLSIDDTVENFDNRSGIDISTINGQIVAIRMKNGIKEYSIDNGETWSTSPPKTGDVQESSDPKKFE